MSVRIVAISHAVPPMVQTASELAAIIGCDVDWIRNQAGVERRHCCQPTDDPAVLVAPIARTMIEEHGNPDLVIHAGAMTRQLLPDTAIFVARELGLAGVPCFTINATCLSFVVALQNAAALIASGGYHRILITSSELGTPGRNFDQPEAAALIGDGAAAVLIERDESTNDDSASSPGIEHFKMQSWPVGAKWSEVRGGGVVLPPHLATPADHLFHMEGEKLMRFVVPNLSRFLKNFFAKSQVNWDQIDHIVPHQASAAGMKILLKMGAPENKIVNILRDYGNCGAASIPMALSVAHQESRISRGDRVLLLGTAAGVSIGAALLRW